MKVSKEFQKLNPIEVLFTKNDKGNFNKLEVVYKDENGNFHVIECGVSAVHPLSDGYVKAMFGEEVFNDSEKAETFKCEYMF